MWRSSSLWRKNRCLITMLLLIPGGTSCRLLPGKGEGKFRMAGLPPRGDGSGQIGSSSPHPDQTSAPLPRSRGLLSRGPLYSSPEALAVLLKEGAAFLRGKGGLVWKMDPAIPKGDGEWLEAVRSLNLKPVETGLDFAGVQPRFVMTLDLTRSLDTLLNNMKSKTRYNIRYAMRKGVYIQPLKEKSRLSVLLPAPGNR